jgi:hypothetical protein
VLADGISRSIATYRWRCDMSCCGSPQGLLSDAQKARTRTGISERG